MSDEGRAGGQCGRVSKQCGMQEGRTGAGGGVITARGSRAAWRAWRRRSWVRWQGGVREGEWAGQGGALCHCGDPCSVTTPAPTAHKTAGAKRKAGVYCLLWLPRPTLLTPIPSTHPTPPHLTPAARKAAGQKRKAAQAAATSRRRRSCRRRCSPMASSSRGCQGQGRGHSGRRRCGAAQWHPWVVVAGAGSLLLAALQPYGIGSSGSQPGGRAHATASCANTYVYNANGQHENPCRPVPLPCCLSPHALPLPCYPHAVSLTRARSR